MYQSTHRAALRAALSPRGPDNVAPVSAFVAPYACDARVGCSLQSTTTQWLQAACFRTPASRGCNRRRRPQRPDARTAQESPLASNAPIPLRKRCSPLYRHQPGVRRTSRDALPAALSADARTPVKPSCARTCPWPPTASAAWLGGITSPRLQVQNSIHASVVRGAPVPPRLWRLPPAL